jgi:hypothetical protein
MYPELQKQTSSTQTAFAAHAWQAHIASLLTHTTASSTAVIKHRAATLSASCCIVAALLAHMVTIVYQATGCLQQDCHGD